MRMTIWIDNDACPKDIRELIYRAGKRLGIPVKIVANSFIHIPSDMQVEMIVVGREFDAADNKIAEEVVSGDLVITSDIPLADRVVKKGAVAISTRGQIYDAENIGEQLALRNLRQELRSSGDIMGGPKPLNKEDHGRFAAAFDRLLTKLMRQTVT